MHTHRCKRKHNISFICTKCQSPLTNTHILGGCRYTAKLRTKRHNSTFRLLLQHIKKSNGRRWPILCADLGQKPITDFSKIMTDQDTSSHTTHQRIPHPYKKVYKTTNKRTPTTLKPYPTTCYTLNTNPKTINRTSSGRLDSCSTHKAN